jgi:very-short-patch-repair endonuclease
MEAKFMRQVPLGPYVADFVCFEAKIIVEHDGGQHAESKSDAIRDRYFIDRGYRVLRFWNNDALRNMDGVLTRIVEALSLQAGTPRGSPFPFPQA